jgi:arabinose-5-phosphate isomerase
VRPEKLREIAQEVVNLEAGALLQLAAQIPNDFVSVVELIFEIEGRVIVAGVGKSGHIGRKIAATLASTGTPSIFVHPTEASHGDLGMITKQDVCILISNSGETRELGDLISYTRKLDIPLVAISSVAGSSLMKTADFQLGLPKADEACAIGLAPTTSTTLTLALGDALAIALMRKRKFEVKRFRDFHPGGSLGSQLARAEDLMHTGKALPLICETTLMSDGILVMSEKGFGVIGVTKQEKFEGIITDGDLRRNINGLLSKTASEIASRYPINVGRDTSAADVLRVMNENKITAVFVLDDSERPIGIVHVHDLLRIGLTDH